MLVVMVQQYKFYLYLHISILYIYCPIDRSVKTLFSMANC